MTRKDLDSLQTAENIIRAVFPDENFQYYYDSLMMIEVTRARYYASKKDNENAMLHLRDALEIAEEKSSKGNGNFSVTIFDKLPPEREDVTLIEQLYHILESGYPDFEEICTTEDYKQLVNEVRKII